jgi:hypothetical protein
MEILKRLDEVCQPDPRQLHRYNLDETTGAARAMGLEDIHAAVEGIRLGDSVPEPVRSHFEVARNLVVYSWFVYSFNVVAALWAFASLEMAVKEKTSDRRLGFKDQLDRVFNGRQLVDGLSLSTAITKLRNDLAHGSTTMHNQGLTVLRVCSELINELFP